MKKTEKIWNCQQLLSYFQVDRQFAGQGGREKILKSILHQRRVYETNRPQKGAKMFDVMSLDFFNLIISNG